MREVVADVLLSHGHRVTLAGGGQEGLARFERDPFDLVITDLGMPDVNGWDVARAVKSARQGLPVLLLTGWADAEEAGVGRGRRGDQEAVRHDGARRRGQRGAGAGVRVKSGVMRIRTLFWVSSPLRM